MFNKIIKTWTCMGFIKLSLCIQSDIAVNHQIKELDGNMHNALLARDLVFAASLSLVGALMFDGIMLEDSMEWTKYMGGIPFTCIESYDGIWIRYRREGILFMLHPTRSWLWLNWLDNIETQTNGKGYKGLSNCSKFQRNGRNGCYKMISNS